MQAIDRTKSCATICGEKWNKDHQSLLAVLFRLGEITRLLASTPCVAADQDAEVVSIKAQIASGLALPSCEGMLLPSDFLTSMEKFNKDKFVPKATEVLRHMNSKIELSAENVFRDLKQAVAKIVGTNPCTYIPLDDKATRAVAVAWAVEHKYVKTLLDFVLSAKDSKLECRLNFILALQRFLPKLAQVWEFWVAAKRPTEAETMEAKKLTQTCFNLLKELRIAFVDFKKVVDPSRMAALVESFAPPACDVQVLAGLFKPDALAAQLQSSALSVLADAGNTWGSHMKSLADKITSWCPPVFVDKRDELLSHPEVMKRLICNPNYEHIPVACNLLEAMRKLGKGFLKGAEGLGGMVDPSTLKTAAEVVKQGVECVSLTFGLFIVTVQLPSMQNLVDRKEVINNYKTSLKGVTMPTDIGKKLEEFEQPDCKLVEPKLEQG